MRSHVFVAKTALESSSYKCTGINNVDRLQKR